MFSLWNNSNNNNNQIEEDNVSFQTCLNRVIDMVSDSNARTLVGRHGLAIQNVSWEDNARFKGSCWGPCISDMTLQVNGTCLPVIRHPNFTDLTWDVPMEKIPLIVGNEVGNPLYSISLKEYLENFRMYLTNPQSWKGNQNSLYASSRDSHVIMSAQACFLPVPKGKESTFNVCLYNYQSSSTNPAVLSIVATSKGTSAQVIQNGGYCGQKLYFNKNGEKCSFVGQRLSDNRKERGVEDSGQPMSQQEKQDNVILIIQVPLKVAQRSFFGSTNVIFECESFNTSIKEKKCRSRMQNNTEDAIIKIGESEGAFQKCSGCKIERDPSFPVRVTLQYYKCTDNGVIDANVVQAIADQLKEAQKKADFVGSLVVNPISNRPTEHYVQPQYWNGVLPLWWNNWWLTYRNNFPNLTEDDAKNRLFRTGKISTNSSLPQVETQIFSILAPNTTFSSPFNQPQWNLF